MITTYTELQEAVASWLNRTDLSSRIPDFIANAEARLNKRVRHRDMETSSAVTFDADGEASLPTGYVEARMLEVDTTPKVRPEFVEPDSSEFLFRFRPFSVPQYFTVFADTLKVQPAQNVTGTFSYFEKIPALTDAAPGNWLLTRSPEAYLYASLVEAATFLRDNEALQTYATLLEAAVSELLDDGRKRRLSREAAPQIPPSQTTQEQLR